MDSPESQVAMHPKARLVVNAISNLVKWAYGVKLQDADYFDDEQKKKPAVFAVKHQHMVDFVASIYVFRQFIKKEQIQIPVKEGLFKIKPLAALLEESGAVPMRRPTDEGYSTDMRSGRKAKDELLKYLKEGGWYAYCPEGTRNWKAVGTIPKSYVLPMVVAARAGVEIYVVGIEYETRIPLPISPWIPFLTTVTVRFERYNPLGKTLEQAAHEVEEVMARLSGLECRLETEASPAAARAQAPAKRSTSGYN
ncbi:1-acyl-sn-glycerol-3-phosphate acyltransferase [Candidatus Woesearchaeota archaeon]|nr:1-acyl-sn-glycerol-3-phosphate acyltransferase [Candidatus Woesearchaeota archaeon]